MIISTAEIISSIELDAFFSVCLIKFINHYYFSNGRKKRSTLCEITKINQFY